jgi:hypothetical protein
MYRARLDAMPHDLEVHHSAGPRNVLEMAARLLYLTLTRMLSWLALLGRRRSALIAETLTPSARGQRRGARASAAGFSVRQVAAGVAGEGAAC